MEDILEGTDVDERYNNAIEKSRTRLQIMKTRVADGISFRSILSRFIRPFINHWEEVLTSRYLKHWGWRREMLFLSQLFKPVHFAGGSIQTHGIYYSNESVKIVMPKEASVIEFKNLKRAIRVPWWYMPTLKAVSNPSILVHLDWMRVISNYTRSGFATN